MYRPKESVYAVFACLMTLVSSGVLLFGISDLGARTGHWTASSGVEVYRLFQQIALDFTVLIGQMLEPIFGKTLAYSLAFLPTAIGVPWGIYLAAVGIVALTDQED